MRLRAAIAALMLLALPAHADAPPAAVAPLDRDHPLAGRIWSTAEHRFLGPDELVARAAKADAVILGETHDNPDHHALQAWMLRRLTAGGRAPWVAFEMIDASQRQALDQALANRPVDTVALGEALRWKQNGWGDWDRYRPIAEAAVAAGATVVPANLSRDDTMALGRGESPDLAARLGIDLPLSPDEQAVMAEEIKASHCGELPDRAVPPMVRIQRARDAAMAEAMADGITRGRQAVLIAGAGHARSDRGVPRALARLTPNARMLSLAFTEVEPGQTDPATYDQAFDALWFTPRAEREDPCIAFRRHMEKKGEKSP
ncbi:MAG: ChaN family lipoprotein [Solirubrobacterales bacterium]